MPVQVNMHLPGRVVVLRRVGAASWAATAEPHPLDRPMMEALTYRATGTKPFGQSRITRTVRYLVDEVQRVMRYMAVSAAMYAAPMMVANGLIDEQYDEMSKKKWSLYTTSWMLATRDENGNTPSFEKIAASSPQPYIDAIATYAKLFSGATGVPLNSLGIVQDNPSSAQAIAASREDICIAAEDCINSNAVAMRNIALMAMAVEHNRTIDELSDEQKSVMPHFRNPNMPSLAATADAMTKIAGSLPGFSETREFLTGMGFDASEVESIRAQLRRRQASTILAQTIGQPSTAAGEPMMRVDPATLDQYRQTVDRLADMAEQAALQAWDAMRLADMNMSVADLRDAMTGIVQTVADNYGAAAAELACRLYDQLAEQAGRKLPEAAIPEDTEERDQAIEDRARYLAGALTVEREDL